MCRPTIFDILAVWQLATTKSTFKTGFEHDTTWRVQNWSQKLWNCMFTPWKSQISRPSAENLPPTVNQFFLNRLSLALCHHQLGLLRPFLSTSRSDESRSVIFISEKTGLHEPSLPLSLPLPFWKSTICCILTWKSTIFAFFPLKIPNFSAFGRKSPPHGKPTLPVLPVCPPPGGHTGSRQDAIHDIYIYIYIYIY